MTEPISASPSRTVSDADSIMSIAPEEPNQCTAPPPPARTEPSALPTAGQMLVLEYDKRDPACRRETNDTIRDCSYAAFGVMSSVVAQSFSLGNIFSVGREVLRCADSATRLDSCQDEALLKQAAEERCSDRGGQVIRGDQQILCWEPR